MRIGLAGISHETNTYCQGLTPKDAFYVIRGEKFSETAGQHSDVGGAVDACNALGVEPVGILFASTQPSATIEREAYEAFKEEILLGLAAEMPLEGCVLLLHGAGVVDGIEDLEADLCRGVREVVGDVPVAASFDLHGNVTQAMADELNAVFACHHYPHVDLHERAAEAVGIVHEMARTGRRSRCSVRSVPVLLPTTTTYEGVGETALARLLDLEKQSGIVDLSWFHGFPYTDVAHVGSFVAASYFPEDQAEAEGALDTFTRELWSTREQFRATSLSAEAALAEANSRAEETGGGPVVIHETSDNCGGGTPGDGTHLLRAMLEAGLGGEACFSFLVDPEVAAQAHEAGVGATLRVSLGGKTDDLHGEPLDLEVYVKALHDGRLIMQHMFKGAPLNLGPMARLVVDDMDIVVASRRSQTFDQEPFLSVGIDVMKYKYVALKSSNHFRAGFQQLAKAIVTADTPGLTTHHIEVFPRQKCNRRLWPLDDQATYPEEGASDG